MFRNAIFRRMDGGAMLHSADNQMIGVEFTVPVITRIVLFNSTSIFDVWALFSQVEQQYSAHEYTSPSAEVLKHEAVAPQVVPASFLIKLFLVPSFA